MRKGLLVTSLGLLAVLLLYAPALRADPTVRVIENQHTVRFAEKMTFRLVAEHDEVITGVTLYYRRQRETVTSRAVPTFVAGQHVEALFEKKLERGEIPPGTVMEYYWRLELGNGQRLDIPPQTFVYEDDRFAWQALRADNLTLLYYGGSRDKAQAEDLLGRAQSALSRLQSDVGVTVQDPVRIYIYHNTNDMASALSPRSEGFDQQIRILGEAIGEDTLLLLGDHSGIRQTLAHELSHIVVGLATKNPYAPIPLWLNEGLAVYAEGTTPNAYAVALRDAVRRDALISLRSLSSLTGDPSQVELYYGESASLVEYLLKTYGRDKMSELLRVFQAGTYQEDALRQVYDLGIDELDAQWRQSLGLKPRSALAPAAGNTPSAPATTAAPTPARRSSRGSSPCPLAGIAGGLAVGTVLFSRRVWN